MGGALSEYLLGAYQDHYARDARAAEHLCIELDERDLDAWIDQARALEAENARLRAEVAALALGQMLATARTARVIWTPTGVSVRVDEA